LEFLAHPCVEIGSPGDHIASESRRLLVAHAEFTRYRLVGLPSEERHLPLVSLGELLRLETEKAISHQPHASHTFDLFYLRDRMLAGSHAIVAEEIMPGGD